ncbi:MAG: GIY-YIG nuclease family protein [Lachnospiraceae bacterium]|jgi:putative endonuclease
MNYVYIVECADGTYYTGWTNSLQKRLDAHNSGRGAKYTHSRRPVRLVYSEAYESESEARTREWQIKQLSRAQKEELVLGENRNSPSGEDRRKERKNC